MRILTAIFIHIILLSACSSAKKSQQARINEAYDARTEAQRNQRDMGKPTVRLAQSPPSDSRPAPVAAPVKAAESPTIGSGPAMSTKTGGEWVVTSIKGKFLAIDTLNVRVYMDLTAKSPAGDPVVKPADFIAHFSMAYVMYPDYNNRERLGYGTVPLTAQNVGQEGDHLTLTFDIKRPVTADRTAITSAVLLTEITETTNGTKARNDLTLRFNTTKLGDRYTLFEKTGRQPQLHNYVNAGDTLVIRDVNGTSKRLFGVRYRHDFEAASSPMNTAPRPATKSLSEDSTLTITTNQPFVLAQEGLYYFVEDTTDAAGIGLIVADKRFPKMTRPEKLIKPVLYMSTSSEISELNQAQDTKKALDRYWLSMMSGNEEVAKKTIKAYFDRVEEANRLFTSYKEGWKTDKGMIYIVLGAPDRVQRNREREVWVYNRRANVSEVNFTFTRKPNQFVDDHYELVRYIEYQPIWYPIVEAWRTGAIRE